MKLSNEQQELQKVLMDEKDQAKCMKEFESFLQSFDFSFIGMGDGSPEEALAQVIHAREDDMIKVFKCFDRDHDGFVTADDLKYVLNYFGLYIDDANLAEIIHDFSSDDIQKLHYEEFMALMSSSNLLEEMAETLKTL